MSLASVYHKPAETFIGAGRVGTELLKKADAEDNRRMTQKALQTVAAGQRIENLLDFDSAEISSTGAGAGASDGPAGLGGLAAMEIPPAAKNLISGTSSNPLDDLVSIFGSARPAPPAPSPGVAQGAGLADLGSAFASPVQKQPIAAPAAQQDDLLGLC